MVLSDFEWPLASTLLFAHPKNNMPVFKIDVRTYFIGRIQTTSPLMFSLEPRCHGLCGSQKYTAMLVYLLNSLCCATSPLAMRHALAHRLGDTQQLDEHEQPTGAR